MKILAFTLLCVFLMYYTLNSNDKDVQPNKDISSPNTFPHPDDIEAIRVCKEEGFGVPYFEDGRYKACMVDKKQFPK